VYTKATRNEFEAKILGKFVDIPDLHLGPPRLAFWTPRGSRDPRLRTTGLVFRKRKLFCYFCRTKFFLDILISDLSCCKALYSLLIVIDIGFHFES